MKKNVKLRYSMWALIFILIISFSFISCEKDDDLQKSNLPVFVAGVLETNATYRLEGVTEFDVILSQKDTFSVSVEYGPHVSLEYAIITDTVSTHVKIYGEFVRFTSSDYIEADDNDAIVLVSNLQ